MRRIRTFLERYKELVGDALIIVFGGHLSVVFLMILLYGEVAIVEPRWLVALAEFLMGLGVTALGADRLRRDLVRTRER